MSADRPNAVDNGQIASGKPAVPPRGILDSLDLGNRVIVYYDDGTSEVIDKGRLSDPSSGVSYLNAQLSADTAAADRAQQQQQFLETFGYNKARGDQQIQLQQAQQKLAEAEAAGYLNGSPTLSRERLGLDQQNSAFNYYKWLADTYSNPRNFWESLFVSRGAQPPAFAQSVGTNSALRGFFAGAPAAQSASSAPAPRPAPTPAATGSYNPTTDPYRGTMYEGLSGFNPDGTKRLAPNDPDAQSLMAKYPGQYRIGFAAGGITPEPMTAVGDISGNVYRIGEKGPEGVVPTDMLPAFLRRRHGQVMGPMRAYARGGELGYDAGSGGTGDPFYPDNFYDPYAPQPADPYFGLSAGTVDQSFNPNPYLPGDANYIGPSAPQPVAPHDQVIVPQTTPAPLPTPIPTGAPIGPYGGDPTGTGSGLPLPPRPEDIPPAEVPISGPTIQQPGFLPQNGLTATPQAAGALMPRDVSAPGTFGNLIGNRPQFLPGEDQQTPVSQLLAAGYLPPFLSRLIAQSRGIQSQGTNQPQRFDFPSDLPIASSLALAQMSPSERAALESIVSAYGIPWEDYLAYIQSVSPQGATATSPTFGNQFFSYRQ